MNLRWLIATLVLSCVLFAAHIYALATYAYWYYPWFDIPMHMLGGAALGAFALGLGQGAPKRYLLAMIVVVVGWEAFEYVWSISTGQPDYWFDTFLDMANGLIGGAIVFGIYRRNRS